MFNRIFEALARGGGKPDLLMIDATHLKACRTAASLLKKGLFPAVPGAPRAAGTPNCMRCATAKARLS